VEGEQLEIKECPAKRDPLKELLKETAVCLANSRGGCLILGISKKGEVKGCPGIDTAEVKKIIYDGTRPPILVEAEEFLTPTGERLLVVTVPESPTIHATSAGLRLHRVGRDCQPLYPAQEMRLRVAKGDLDYTDLLVEAATLDDLDPLEIERLRRTIEREVRAEATRKRYLSFDHEELLRALQLLRREEGTWQPTMAALLLVGKEKALSEHLPQHQIIYMHMKGEMDYDRRLDLKGPLLACLSRLEETVALYNQVHPLYQGMYRFDVPDWPEPVVREALLNAMIHRDYTASEAINIRHYPDRLQVGNPGGFPGDISPDNIIYHEPQHRNPRLAAVFHQIGLVEYVGFGVDRIYYHLLRYGKEAPLYEHGRDFVRLTIFNGRFHEGMARFIEGQQRAGYEFHLDELLILNHLRSHRELDRAAATRVTQRSERYVSETLGKMVKVDILERLGRGGGAVYRLSRRMYELLGKEIDYYRERGLDRRRHEALVLDYVRDKGQITNEVCRELLRISKDQAKYLLSKMTAGGLLNREGRGPKTRYVLPE